MADEIAEKLYDEERFEEAAKRLEELVEKEDHPGNRLRLASILYKIGKVSDALAHARRVSDVESEHREDAILLVAYCLRIVKRWREASKVFYGFWEKYPNAPRARMAKFSSALCLEELDDWTGAIEIYETMPDDEAEFRKAICMERAGRPDDAARLFESFLEKHGESPEAVKVKFRLGAMRVRQGKYDEALKLLSEVSKRCAGTFMGQMADRLIERTKAKATQIARQLKSYS